MNRKYRSNRRGIIQSELNGYHENTLYKQKLYKTNRKGELSSTMDSEAHKYIIYGKLIAGSVINIIKIEQLCYLVFPF